MVTVGTRLRIIRKDAGLSQVELGKLAGSNQSAINRYETDRAAVPYRMLIWYAQYFDVSMDYIFGLCDDKRGRIVTVSPEGQKNMYGANRIGASSWKLVSSREVN